MLVCDKLNYVSDKYEMTAAGSGFDYCFNQESFRYQYVEMSGDFEIEMKVSAMTNTTFDSYFGFIIRENLERDAEFASLFITEIMRECYWHSLRGPVNGSYNANEFTYPYIHFKMVKEGDSVYFYEYFADGARERKIINETRFISFSNKQFLVGIALSSGDDNKLASAVFSDLKINGEAVDVQNLKAAEIGTKIEGSLKRHRICHTDFKISKSDEKLYLFDNSENQIDFVEVGAQRTDISYGRFPDASDNFVFFEVPTPNATNANILQEKTPTPVFSKKNGFYNEAFEVTIQSDDDVYYTLDGSEPTQSSAKYAGQPININQDITVLRAKAFNAELAPSKTATHTYFINYDFKLPVISISGDSALFWDNKTGLFSDKNLYLKLEVPIGLEFFKNTTDSIYTTNAGVRLNGNSTRRFKQKPFRLYPRDKYDEETFNYPFFTEEYGESVGKFVLKSQSEAWWLPYIPDMLMNVIVTSDKQLAELYPSPYTSVLTYLNGEYYAIHLLRERVDRSYLGNRHDIENLSIVMTEVNGGNAALDAVSYGDITTWFKLIDTLNLLDISSDGYNYLQSQFEINNLMDYAAINIYSRNRDWIANNNNVKSWKSDELDGKWRFIMHDLDFALHPIIDDTINCYQEVFDVQYNSFAKILSTLLKSDEFKVKFLNRFADLLNTSFLPTRINYLIDSLANVLRPAVTLQKEKYPETCTMWEEQVAAIKEIAIERQTSSFKEVVETHSLPGTCKVNISSNILDACDFELNTISFSNAFEGTYFQGIPITLTVKPKEGYRFVGWNDEQDSSKKTITVDLTGNESIDIKAILSENGSVTSKNEKIFNIYPNPVKNKMYIEFESNHSESIQIRIKDILGNDIYTVNGVCEFGKNNLEIDFEKTGKFANGSYLVEVKSAHLNLISKIIYQR